MLLIFLFLLQLVAPVKPIVYVPVTIDSLWDSKAQTVQLTGTVAVVSVTNNEKDKRPVISFMLGDSHGHFVRCVLPHDEPQAGPTPYVDQPRVGLQVIVFGTRRPYSVEERGQGVVEIDPVAKIQLVEIP
jgi:hypothetical protein